MKAAKGHVGPRGTAGPRGGRVVERGDLRIEVLGMLREVWLTVLEGWDVLPANEADSADVLIRNTPRNRYPGIEVDGNGQRWLNLPRGWRLRVQTRSGTRGEGS